MDSSGNTRLIINTTYCNIDGVIQLLNGNPTDINHQNIYQDTALIIATRYNYPQIIRLLLESGASVNIIGRNKMNALLWGVSVCNIETIKYLLMYADNNDMCVGNLSSLHIAVNKNKVDVVKILLDRNSSAEYTDHIDWQGNTSLIIACKQGNEEIVKLILDTPSKGNINYINKNKFTALMYAVSYEWANIINMLV